MLGTIVNVLAIVLGSLIGITLKDKFPEKIQLTVMQGISLAVVLIGMQMALEAESVYDILIVIFSLVLGGIIGELLGIESRIDSFGETIKKKLKNNNDLFVQGFVNASLVYCIGAMAIMGAIQEGLNNDPSILLTKSLLDGISSIAFAASTGIGVMFSVIPVFIYQGGITLMASWAQNILTPPLIRVMTVSGGLLILGISMNILGITRIRVGNLLPSLFISIILAMFLF
jgi:uncharacterized protein